MHDRPCRRRRFFFPILILSTALAAGCASTQTKVSNGGDPDPLEPPNRAFFTFNETLDKYFFKPVAETYVDITPSPVRTAVTNFFDNLTYLNVIVNSILQGKFHQGLDDMSRFIINSTIGLGGLFDMASDAGLVKHDEDLGQTLAVWGVPQGAYLYLPIKGPNSFRDAPDMASSYFLNPITYLSGVVLFPITAIGVINARANLLEETRIRDEAAVDSYSFTREAYIQRRRYLIYDGNPPSEGYETIFEDEEDDNSHLQIK